MINENCKHSARLNYWKTIPISLGMCALINLLAFGLRVVMFSKGEITELIFTLVISIAVSILIGARLVSKQINNIGWSLIIGATLTLLIWVIAFYFLSTHGW